MTRGKNEKDPRVRPAWVEGQEREERRYELEKGRKGRKDSMGEPEAEGRS